MKRALSITLKAFLIVAILFFALACAALAYYIGVTHGLKLDPEKLQAGEASMTIYDRSGTPLVCSPSARESVPFSELPPCVANAFVAVEDKRFFEHHGLDTLRMGKAFLKNLASFSFKEGASTISQQLIKNTHLSGEKTVNRKLKEMKLTKILEKRYSKSEILDLYLNSIYFGHGSFGIASAAKFYFGHGASELTNAESAMLAALVKSPNRYSPFKNPGKCLSRRNFVLGLMQEQGYLSEEEARAAKETELPVAPNEEQGKNAYLTRVFEEVSELLPERDFLSSLSVYTYLDEKAQSFLDGKETESDFSAVVIENGTRGITALSSTCALPKRLPASTLKPLLVYAPALEENLISPATPVLDEKVDFAGYSPKNADGKFRGYVSAREALAKSINVPAVKILNSLGLDRAKKYLEKMNLRLDEDDLSLALALGGMKQGFSLDELTAAYATFPAGGVFATASTVQKITDATGKTLYERKTGERRVFSQETAFVLTDMLQTTVKAGTAKKLNALPFPVAAKTGTAAGKEGNTDAYTFAYTSEHTVGVWLGNRDYSPVASSGGGLPANYASELLSSVYKSRTPAPFIESNGVTRVALCKTEYEKNHALVLADPMAPKGLTFTELFKNTEIPKAQSSVFSRPSIAMPTISVKNGAVKIELCQTEYYDYVIKRACNGQICTVYEGKYVKSFTDSSVKAGNSYVYTVIPKYKEIEGEAVILPSIRIAEAAAPPDDWWDLPAQRKTACYFSASII